MAPLFGVQKERGVGNGVAIVGDGKAEAVISGFGRCEREFLPSRVAGRSHLPAATINAGQDLYGGAVGRDDDCVSGVVERDIVPGNIFPVHRYRVHGICEEVLVNCGAVRQSAIGFERLEGAGGEPEKAIKLVAAAPVLFIAAMKLPGPDIPQPSCTKSDLLV